jgi:hypothetical protein
MGFVHDSEIKNEYLAFQPKVYIIDKEDTVMRDDGIFYKVIPTVVQGVNDVLFGIVITIPEMPPTDKAPGYYDFNGWSSKRRAEEITQPPSVIDPLEKYLKTMESIWGDDPAFIKSVVDKYSLKDGVEGMCICFKRKTGIEDVYFDIFLTTISRGRARIKTYQQVGVTLANRLKKYILCKPKKLRGDRTPPWVIENVVMGTINNLKKMGRKVIKKMLRINGWMYLGLTPLRNSYSLEYHYFEMVEKLKSEMVETTSQNTTSDSSLDV